MVPKTIYNHIPQGSKLTNQACFHRYNKIAFHIIQNHKTTFKLCTLQIFSLLYASVMFSESVVQIRSLR